MTEPDRDRLMHFLAWVAEEQGVHGVPESPVDRASLVDEYLVLLPIWGKPEFTEGGLPSFTCPRCNKRSFHPKDIEFGFCGNCHSYTGEGQRW